MNLIYCTNYQSKQIITFINQINQDISITKMLHFIIFLILINLFYFYDNNNQPMKGKPTNTKQQQLKVKLEAIRSIQQLKKIYGNVEEQSNTLREDVMALRYKVELLVHKQKTQNSYVSKQDEGKGKQLHACQDELKQQYKIMHELKKRREISHSEKGTDQLNEQTSSYSNKLKKLQTELSDIKVQAIDLKKEAQRLEKTIANQEQEQKRNEPKINEYSSQNGSLKKKILSLRKIQIQKEYESVKTMNSMYTVKTKCKKNDELQQQIQSKKLSKTNQKLSKSKSETIDQNALSKQVQQLKKQKQRKQKELVMNDGAALRKKQQLIRLNKDSVVNLRDLQQKKARMLSQLNKYKKIWTKYIEVKNNNKNSKQFIATPLQADQYVSQSQPLRRDYAGILGGKYTFDDRLALKENSKSYMIGFIVYQLDQTAASKNMLVGLRAIYDDAQASALNQLPIPGSVLAKCKSSKYALMQGDFIKLFKVKYHAVDSRIIKIQIRTNKNNKYQFGDKRPFNDLAMGENVYGFDISVQEYPVCLFGSYNNVRSQWYMQSLGVQINEFDANGQAIK